MNTIVLRPSSRTRDRIIKRFSSHAMNVYRSRLVLVRVSVEALICLLYSCASSLRRGGLPTVPLSEVAPPSLGAPATYYGNFSRSQGRDQGNGNVPLTRAILSQYPRVPNVFRTATLGTCSGTCSNGVDLPFLEAQDIGVIT